MTSRDGRSGWAFGERIPADGKFLTILGSALEVPVLHPTREAAEQALAASSASKSPHLRLEVAHVTEEWHAGVSGGYAHRVTEPPAPERSS